MKEFNLPSLPEFVNNAVQNKRRAPGNSYVNFDDRMSVYVRVSHRPYVDPKTCKVEFTDMLDIGNVSINDPANYRKGLFKKLLLHAAQVCIQYNIEYVYVECVLNYWLKRYLLRTGFTGNDLCDNGVSSYQSFFMDAKSLQKELIKQLSV